MLDCVTSAEESAFFRHLILKQRQAQRGGTARDLRSALLHPMQQKAVCGQGEECRLSPALVPYISAIRTRASPQPF